MKRNNSALNGALTDIFADLIVGLVVTTILYVVFLVKGSSTPAGSAIGIGAWIFCVWTAVHCLLTDGGSIIIVSFLLACIVIAVGIVYMVGSSLLQLLV